MIDKFSNSRRRAWQSRVPSWPFCVAALAVVAAVGWWVSGDLLPDALGDGTRQGQATLWFSALGALVLISVILGAGTAALLNGMILQPAGRRGAMLWAGVLSGVALLAGAPATVARTLDAHAAGYALRLVEGLQFARRQQAGAYAGVHRELAFTANSDAFSPHGLDRPDGFTRARKRLAHHQTIVAGAPARLAKADADARAALADSMEPGPSRDAVLERFDGGAAEKAPLLARYWDIHARIGELAGRHLDLLESDRSGWRPMGSVFMFSNRGQFRASEAMRAEAQALAQEAIELERRMMELDAATNDGIDRVIEQESDGRLTRRERRSAERPAPLGHSGLKS